MKKISMEEFESEFDASIGAQCLDVREPSEYAQIHLKSFNLYPLSQLSEKSVEILKKSKPTYLLCRTGSRACQAADKLEKMGFTDLNVIEGGIGVFEGAGKPLIKGSSKVWGLERQVRFGAGTLVLLGIVLAKTVHPAGIFVSLFVAGGLVFSAVTDTCGMGMLLARMPWNQSGR
ncbi:MAG: rhodanese-related sulfurtransferase [Candidatus Omnitrophota bacterium]|jgi:rhodanese-related sulfurtransferase